MRVMSHVQFSWSVSFVYVLDASLTMQDDMAWLF